MLQSLIRTYVPLLVAVVVSGLASLGVTVDSQSRALLVTAIGTIVAAAYYAIARILERKYPSLSLLLGSSVQPASYSPDGVPVVTSLAAQVNAAVESVAVNDVAPAVEAEVGRVIPGTTLPPTA